MRFSALLLLLAPALSLAKHARSFSSHPHMERHSATNATLAKRTVATRYAFAHVVFGDWQSYTSADWIADITLAKDSGLDAFALNVGGDATDSTQLAIAYAAASSVGGFKLFISLDMTYTATFGSTANILAKYVTPYIGHAAQFYYNSELVLSTFSGENPGTYLDGNSDINAAWAAFKVASGISICFLPFWTGLTASTAVTNHPAIDGIGNWQAWPTGDNAPTTTLDVAFQTDATNNGKLYIAPVSAFFNVHLTNANNTRMEQIIAMTNVPTMIEVLTWNDYGESCPVRANAGLPYSNSVNSASYVTGFAHDNLLGLLKVYLAYYKAGSFPAKAVTSTELYYWYRPHPKSATASADPIGRQNNADSTEDYIYVAAILARSTSVHKIRVEIGGTSTDFALSKAKVTLVKVPFVAGTPYFSLLNSASTVITGKRASGPAIVSSPTTYNFNYYTGTLKE
ncbi:hypothetical protein RQP46_000982 [Phenoliferia psychrophenolica]